MVSLYGLSEHHSMLFSQNSHNLFNTTPVLMVSLCECLKIFSCQSTDLSQWSIHVCVSISFSFNRHNTCLNGLSSWLSQHNHFKSTGHLFLCGSLNIFLFESIISLCGYLNIFFISVNRKTVTMVSLCGYLNIRLLESKRPLFQ